jgi:hypothetical protein
VLVVVAFGLVAVLAGLIWPRLVDPVVVTRTEEGPETGEVALAERFDNDGWYAVLAAGLGLVLGVALTAWQLNRRRPELAALAAVFLGAAVAAWLMSRVGTAVGPPDPATVLAEADVGATAVDQVRVTARAAYLVWPIAAVLGAMLVLWGPADRAASAD